MRIIGWVKIEFVEGEAECEACGTWMKGKFIRGESHFGGRKPVRQCVCMNCGRDVLAALFDSQLPEPPPSLLRPERN